MKAVSIHRHLLAWGLGALGLGLPLLMGAAYWLTLGEIDEVLDDSLRQTALLLADGDLAATLPANPTAARPDPSDIESGLVAIGRGRNGTLMFSSQPERTPDFAIVAGLSKQHAFDSTWKVFTVIQKERSIQVAQPLSVRREVAAESASQLVLSLAGLLALIAALLVIALRRGLRPLGLLNEALAQRDAESLEPIKVQGMPTELAGLVDALNKLLSRLAANVDEQRRFVADAAHELRSPVTALQLQLELMRDTVDPQERSAAMAELAQGVARTRRVGEQLLALSRATSAQALPGQGASVDLAQLVREAVGRWSTEAERRGIDLGADAPEHAPSVHGDHAQLEILLNNLIDNGLRYTPRGGIVDVGLSVADGVQTLRVVDSGLGIAADQLSRVFDRFYRSPEAIATGEAGSGLGLAIVRAIADRHGAQVSLRAGAEGKGLEVRVAFVVHA